MAKKKIVKLDVSIRKALCRYLGNGVEMMMPEDLAIYEKDPGVGVIVNLGPDVDNIRELGRLLAALSYISYMDLWPRRAKILDSMAAILGKFEPASINGDEALYLPGFEWADGDMRFRERRGRLGCLIAQMARRTAGPDGWAALPKIIKNAGKWGVYGVALEPAEYGFKSWGEMLGAYPEDIAVEAAPDGGDETFRVKPLKKE